MEAKIYNKKGKESGSFKLPENVFGLPWNADLVHQVAESMKSDARKPVAHTKNRGEVRGGGKKPWQQKGTGRARHGSIRSPLWVGGGVTHGPRNEKNFERKVNKKMKAKALYTILSKKFKDGEILFVESFGLTAPKTKEAKDIVTSIAGISGFQKISTKKRNVLYIAFDGKNEAAEKSFRNMGNVYLDEARNMSPLDVLDHKYVMFVNPEVSVKSISEKLTKTK